MNAPAPPRQTTPRDGGLVEEDFPITERRPGELPPHEDKLRVAAMRRLTRDCLQSKGLNCVADEAVLLVSELVTNAILHSGGHHVRVILDLEGGFLRIRVHDGVPGPRPTVHQPGEEDEHGRGLALVHEITRSRRGAWGVTDDGATTWCQLSLAAN